MNKHELTDVMLEMVEHAGVELILEELIQCMSTDELKENVKHLDQHLFENHFLTREDWKFVRIFKQKKERWEIWVTAALKTQWTIWKIV